MKNIPYKNKTSSFFIFLFSIVCLELHAMDNEDLTKSSTGNTIFTQEGFLPKDETYFDFSKKSPYLTKTNFDRIFQLVNSQNFNPLASKLEVSTFQEKKEISYVSGSASVVSVDEKIGVFRAITNAHVVYDNDESKITNFSKAEQDRIRYGTLKQAMLSETQYIRGEIDTVCFSNQNRDLAVVSGKYTNKIPYEGIKGMISFENCIEKSQVKLYGHPTGVNEQRIRKGVVNCQNETHTISSLPGDSGSGIYSEKGGYLGTHTGGDPNSLVRDDIILENKKSSLKEYEANKFLLVTKDNLDNEFTNCYTKHYI
jgi:hypothetical protein